MSGRLEHHAHIDKIVRERLEDSPEIIKEYFKKSTGLQATSRHVAINNIKRFVMYLTENGFDLQDDKWYCKITSDDILDYFYTIKTKKQRNGKTKVLSDATIKTMWNYLNNFFEFLLKKKYITCNPMVETKEDFPTQRNLKKVVYMTPEEVKYVKNKIENESKYPKRDLCIFMIGCRTGLRQSAITEIDISDIDFYNMTIEVIEKGNVRKDVIIDPDTINLINDCIKERGNIPGEDALFIRVNKDGSKQRITAWDMKIIIDKYTDGINKRITPHKMRSTCGTNLYIQTGDIYAVADRLGHSNLNNTRRYTDTIDKGRKSANIMGNIF